MNRLRAVIADDEPLARARVARLLGAIGTVDVVASCTTGTDAVAAVIATDPDVVFLDIDMPGLDGFRALEALPPHRQPRVVFVTAYSAHAVRAFDVQALDYVLKPVSGERLRAAVDRVRASMHAATSDASGTNVHVDAHERFARRIGVPQGLRIVLVPVEDIDYVSAHANYVELHTPARSWLLRETLSGILARLDPAQFLRVHRSRIVRVDAIAEVEPQPSGQYLLRLRSGVRIGSGCRHREPIRDRLGLR